ncbi:ABC transporter permease [Gemmatirosa kalamazoonensis]|uniref:ABC transporter permease n=1 Tax=Gemmatirosa kalamazoonensis TaxID=861299 RepID=UPI00046D28E5|nr:ABC transporter permease [Gemmatirosa kalamazoonensis]
MAPIEDASAAPAPEPRAPTALEDLRVIVSELAESGDLLKQLVLRDIRIRYKQAVLGFAWAVLMPAVIVLAGLAIRYAIANAGGLKLGMHHIAGMALKSVPWAFFAGCISMSTPCLTANGSLVTKVYFPREVLPLSAVLAQTFDSAIGLVLITAVIPVFHLGVSAQLLWVPLLLLCLWMLAAASALVLSCANLFFRDVKYVVQVFLTFGIFVTPVFMDAAMYGPKGSRIVMLNPVAPVLEGLRLVVVEHHDLLQPYVTPRGGFVVWHPWYLAYALGVATVGLVLGALVFHRAERRFAEII